MEFRHLRYFLVLAEELHFGRAARRLAISQPPLSLNIQQLEASVGAVLLTRNSKSVQLTAAGRAFVPAARALLDQAAQAAHLAKDVSQGIAGSLSIAFAGTMIYNGLPEILARFQAAHPLLRVMLKELSSSEQLIELAHDRLDLGFVHTTRVPPELSQILVASQAFVVCLPAGHALANLPAVALKQLRGEPLAVVSRTVSPDYHDRIIQACLDAGFYPEIRYELQHWLSVVSLVSRGMGVALVPEALQKSAMLGTVFVPLDSFTAPYDTHCLWKTSRDSAALAAFVAAVRGLDVPEKVNIHHLYRSFSLQGTKAATINASKQFKDNGMNPYIWCVVGALLGGAVGLLMKTSDRTIVIENVLVGVFGAYIGGDFVAVMVNGRLLNEDFSAASFGYAVTGAVVSLLLLRLMRRAVGPLRPAKKRKS